ncbi:CHAT domain-containing protein [Seonamhaeicola algicola]|uniref:CHAT domain-containing protein n=1 Tax=Seonamhaeicola algicola TaxID=1719036 RepID=A0A5C7B4E5_9FLAO|nr:CHAT domain-containing protein [Seonamhaeicola algicola]TXE12752.1 CHAT domain-containing protein [Seonamhaeicola algicola]
MTANKLLFIFLGLCNLIGGQSEISNLKLKIEDFYIEKQYDSVVNISKNYSWKSLKFINENDSLVASEVFHNIANSYYEKANYTTAIAFYNKSIIFSPKNPEGLNQKGRALYDRAFAEYEIQNYTQSYKTVKQAEVVLSALSNPDYDYLLSVYADLAGEATTLGFYDEAEFYLDKGFNLYQNNKGNFKTNVANASKLVLFHHKYIRLFAYSGNQVKLLKHINKLQTLKNKRVFNATENLMLAVAYNYVGDFYLEKKEPNTTVYNAYLNQGIAYLNKGLLYLDKKAYSGNYTQILFNKAKYYMYSKAYKKALLVNNEIQQIVSENDARMPFFKAQEAFIYLRAKNKAKAINAYKNVVNFIHASKTKLRADYSNFKPSTVVSHSDLLAELADTFVKAYPNDHRVLNEMAYCYHLSLKQLIASYEGEWFSKSLKEYYDKAIAGVLKLKSQGYGNISNAELLQIIETTENRLVWKRYIQNQAFTKYGLEQHVFNEDIHLRKQLVGAIKNNDSLNVAELKFKIEKHNTQLKNKYPNIYKYAYDAFDINNFKNEIPDKTLVLKYKIVDTTLCAFEITKQSVKVTYKVFDSVANKKVVSYLKTLKNRGENKPLAENLWQLLKPTNSNAYTSLIVLPDGVLNNFPFETLVDEGEYLVNNKVVSYASHLVFLEQASKSTTLKKVVVCAPNYSKGNTLNGAKYEKEMLSNMFPNAFIDIKKLTKNELFDKAKQASILHLAMHVKINEVNSELSYFMFDEANTVNNLHLEELYAYKLQANLAFLGACNTGVSLNNGVNGAASIQRAFFMAGVPSVISSFWNVPDDATKKIVSNFYSNLKKGQTKAEALQKAKISYLKGVEDADLSKPYYWAGFVLSGSTNAMLVEDKQNYCMVALVLLGFVFIIGLLKRFK